MLLKVNKDIHNKLGLLDLINPRNITCVKTTKLNNEKNINLTIFSGTSKIEEIIIRKVIPSEGKITAINI